MSKKTHNKFFEKFYFFLISVVVISIIVFFFILISKTNKTSSSINSETMSGEAAKIELISDDPASLKLNLTSKTDISFVKVKLYFKNTDLQLTETKTTSEVLNNVITVTTREVANQSGFIEISLAKDQYSNLPASGTIELAEITFENVAGTESFVTIVDEETQLVGSDSKILPFTHSLGIIPAN